MKKQALRILIVDDSDVDRMLVKHMLTQTGLECEFTEAGAVPLALAACERQTFDVVLTDYNLPGTDGLDGIAALRERSPDCALIMLSGRGDEMVATEAMQRGASDYLPKLRMTSESLNRSLQNALEKRSLRRKLLEKQAELETFTRVLAHDLRSPAASLQTFATRIGEWLEEGNLPKALEYADWINKTAARMNHLIDTLQKYTLADGTVKMEEVKMEEALQASLANLREMIETKNAIVTADKLPAVLGNPPQLIQLLQNLIANGIKYCDKPNPTIQISAAACMEEETGDALSQFALKDNGIGVSEADSKKIFEPFYRAGNAHQRDGTGLGLATCKKIVERHGGQIWCQSKLGEGTSIFFVLPAFAKPMRAEKQSG
jgi:signal transduction histidine kinase